MIADAARASDALYSIPPDLSRDEWVRCGMAAQAAGLDFDAFNDWSAQAANYSERDARDTWRSFKPGKGIGAGTLYQMAAENGWCTGDDKPTAKPASKPVAPPRKPAPGNSASDVFGRFEPATAGHGYVTRKQIAADALPLLRIVPANDPLTHYRGWLAVPGYSPGGTLQTIEFISAGDGQKMTLKDSHKSGASLTVGPATGAAVVVEGLGAASAAYMATGFRSIACFGAGNIKRVVEALRKREPETHITIAPDRGKELDARNIATEFNCAVACLPASEPSNFDINDLGLRDGFDAVEFLLSQATEPPKPPPLLKPVSVGDVLTNPSPPPAFIWDRYLPRGTVSLFGAHGGIGKSTFALMLAVCAVLGMPLFGITTELVKAIFVSLEDGAHVVRHRLAHICRTWAIDPEQLRDRLVIVDGTEHPELFAAETRGAGETTATYAELRRLVQAESAGLVVVDNASDAFGGDEIQRRQVRAFMRALAEIARLTDCAVLVLAHVDKTTSRNRTAAGGEAYSGSTAWHNSARSRMFLTRAEDGTLTLEHQKSNLGRMRDPVTLTWPDGGLPMLASEAPGSGLTSRMNDRADDDRAIALIRLIAEFEGRGQYCSPATTSRNHVHAVLRSEPAFQKLKIGADATRRIVNQCQRARWIEPLDYRTPDRKPHQGWTVTALGRTIAGLPAPTAPTAPTTEDGAHSASGAPTAPTCIGGVGDRARTQDGASEVLQ